MAQLTKDDIKRVKGLGALQDKRFEDVFNIRVITGYGKVTADQQRIVAEAAEKFGTGEVALTTRLTFEIQGVKYENIEPLIAFLGEHGMVTGGTGNKVRPVVSCKGTTCVFGLIDTYSLASKIHERFYLGKHGVELPKKFKIGVGGCPNNCIKPNLNDMGIRGAVVPKDVNPSGRGYLVYLGGHWGKTGGAGTELSKLCYTEDEVLDLIEKVINFYKENGEPGERLFKVIERLGIEAVEKAIFA